MMTFAPIVTEWLWRGPAKRKTALVLFGSAFATILAGAWTSKKMFPGYFDWQYRVISGLASQVDNPTGYWPFCLSITLSFALVFPLAGYLQKVFFTAPTLSGVSAALFRFGSVAGMLVGVERGWIHNVSSLFYKSHEALAALAFSGIFLGVVGFFICWCRAPQVSASKAGAVFLLVVGPFTLMALSQATIYLKYRHLGWVSPQWREWGVPLYLSFAFWQWMASLGAYLSMGLLCLVAPAPSVSSDTE